MSEYFPKVEGILRRYMLAKSKIERLEIRLNAIEQSIRQLKYELEHSELKIPEPSLGVNYSGVYVKTQPSSYMERAIEQYGTMIEKMQAQLVEYEAKRLRLISKINRLKNDIQDIEVIVNGFDELEKQFIEMKYGDKMSNYQIAEKLHIGATTVRRKRMEIVEKVAEALGLKG